MIYTILGIFLIVELGGLFWNSAIVTGLNPRADKLKVYAMEKRDDQTILPGDIYDRNGQVIAETSYKKIVESDDKGNKKESAIRTTTYSDGLAYSQIIGYTGPREFNPLADSIIDVVGDRNDYRLMAYLDESVWNKNGLYKVTDVDGTKGQSAILTIDNDLQMAVYHALSKEMSITEDIGSAVVMNVKTGEILSMVSFPAYDFNDLTSAKQKMLEDAENTDLEPSFPVSYKNSEAPGSIIKILMSVALIDHGMESFSVDNATFTVNNWTCKATEYDSGTLKVKLGDALNIEKALNISSNVFFAQAALALGKDNLKETAEKFMLCSPIYKDEDNDGKDDNDGHTADLDLTYLPSDFGNIQYNWNLDVSDDVLAQTGFGQGKTELTTIYAALIAQAIANDGKMMQPYLIKNLVDSDGHTVYEGAPTLLSHATSKLTAKKVAKMMRSTAEECCRVHHLTSVKEVFDKYEVAGKTGTAQSGDANATDNAWYISFAPADDPQYVVIVNQCKCSKYGYQMMSTVAEIYTYLFKEKS